MPLKIRDGRSMELLRAGHDEGARVFQAPHGLAVLDPELSQALNATNFGDTTLPDRLVDLLRGRKSPEIAWKEIRTGWAAQLKILGEAEHMAALDGRLEALIDARLDQPLDLPVAIQEIFTHALIPTVMADLTDGEWARVRKDQDYKLMRLMRAVPREETRSELIRSAILQMRCSWVARKVLKQRAKGKRPRQLDLADTIVDFLPRLGMDRASFAVTTVLTAIAGPPGAVAVCMLLELVRRPEWSNRMAEELSGVDLEAFHRAPTRTAPVTYRFVREVLRVWSSPLVLTRVANMPLTADDETLQPGDNFHLCPYFVHRHAKMWEDPETFDPDRWLPGSGRGPAQANAYVPFGWAPTSCIGASLGTHELMLLCRQFTTRYRIDAIDPDAVEVVMASVPLPVGFRGTWVRR